MTFTSKERQEVTQAGLAWGKIGKSQRLLLVHLPLFLTPQTLAPPCSTFKLTDNILENLSIYNLWDMYIFIVINVITQILANYLKTHTAAKTCFKNTKFSLIYFQNSNLLGLWCNWNLYFFFKFFIWSWGAGLGEPLSWAVSVAGERTEADLSSIRVPLLTTDRTLDKSHKLYNSQCSTHKM